MKSLSEEQKSRLKTYLNEKKAIVDKALKAHFPEPDGPTADVIKAMTYSLFAGGKRLRPILCMASASVVGGREDDVTPIACALECIHTYSLIHDDLPAMDDDDLRRGKPTNHKVFGDAMALLAGDGLLTEAFHLLAAGPFPVSIPEAVQLKVICIIARASGHQGMVGGQVVDIQSEGKKVDFPTVEFIHRHKTAALIHASVLAGAIAGGGNPDQADALGQYGKKIGLAFQISDDILDVEGDSSVMGKGAGSDEEKEKATFPALIGLQRSKEIQTDLIDEAIKILLQFGDRADPLRLIARYIIERKK